MAVAARVAGEPHSPRDAAEILRILAHRVGRAFRSARRDAYVLNCVDANEDVFAMLARALQMMGEQLGPHNQFDARVAPCGTSELFELLVCIADSHGEVRASSSALAATASK